MKPSEYSMSTKVNNKGWPKSFRPECLFIFDQLVSISDESKAMSSDQNFVIFSDMDSEILFQFLFENSEIIFEKHKKLVWAENFSAHFYIFTIRIGN